MLHSCTSQNLYKENQNRDCELQRKDIIHPGNGQMVITEVHEYLSYFAPPLIWQSINFSDYPAKYKTMTHPYSEI